MKVSPSCRVQLGFARFTVCVLELYFMPLAHHESATGGDGGGSDGDCDGDGHAWSFMTAVTMSEDRGIMTVVT